MNIIVRKQKGIVMEIRNLITFVRIAELRNFSKTAQELGYSQSAVTMQIKQLEAELQAQLFERIGKRAKLTQAGERLLPWLLIYWTLPGKRRTSPRSRSRSPESCASAPASPT